MTQPIDSRALRLREWGRGKRPGPWTLFVFPTYRCNLRCKICGRLYGEEPLELFDELPDERLLALVDEAAELGVKEWSLAGGGEPMLRGDLILEMCVRICDRGMNGILQSNGTLFETDHLERLVEMGWGAVSISIDGPDAASSDAARYKGAFDKSREAVRTLAELKRKCGTASPAISVVSVITAYNCDRLDEMARFVHFLGADSLGLMDLILFDRERMADLRPSKEQEDNLSSTIARVREETERLGIEFGVPAPLSDQRSAIAWPPAMNAHEPPRDPPTAACFEPWLSMVVLSHGIASPCCIFWENDADNIRDRSLREVWLGTYMEQIRRDVLQGPLPSPCKTCPASLYERRVPVLEEIEQTPDESLFFLSPSALPRKAISALRNHGLGGSLKRGREWLEIRRRLRG